MLLVQTPSNAFTNFIQFNNINPIKLVNFDKPINQIKPVNQIKKIDITKFKGVETLYKFKYLTYTSTKRFEDYYYKNNSHKKYSVEVIYNTKKKFYIDGKNVQFHTFNLGNYSVITISYFSSQQDLGNGFTTTRIYYDGIMYKSYAYYINEITSDYWDLLHFRLGYTFMLYNTKQIYEGDLTSVHWYYNKVVKRNISLNSYDKLYKYDLYTIDKKNSNTKQYGIKYNIYADIIEYSTIKECNCSKTIFTTYGISYSHITNNNFYSESKRPMVSKFTNTDPESNKKIESTITSNNEMLELKVTDKQISLDEMKGYKIANVLYQNETHICLLELEIPKNAKIATSNGMKFRTNKVIPTKVWIVVKNELQKNELQEIKVEYAESYVHTSDFIYYINQLCVENNFDGDLDKVCVPGIHYYYNRDNAIITYGTDAMIALI